MLVCLQILSFVTDGQYPLLCVMSALSVLWGPKNNNDYKISSYIMWKLN